MPTIKEAKKSPTYQELSRQLDEILSTLKDPEIDIERSMELYKSGQNLLKQMERILSDLEKEVSLDLQTADQEIEND